MPRQRMRCPQCRHEFTSETPDREGKFVITCPDCSFRSTVTIKPKVSIPSAVMDSDPERKARERRDPPPPFEEVTDAPFQRNVPPPPPPDERSRVPVDGRARPVDRRHPRSRGGDQKKVTMKPLTHKVKPISRSKKRKGKKRPAPPQHKRPPERREGDAVRDIVPPEPKEVVYTLTSSIEEGRLTFHAKGRDTHLSGVQTSPEIVVFNSPRGEELKIEVIDPHVAVFRFLGPRNELLAFMYEKLTGEGKTLHLQLPDGEILTMKGRMDHGPGGYEFFMHAFDDQGHDLGTCDGNGRGFEGTGRFEGDLHDQRLPIGTLAALHLLGSMNE